MAARIGSGGPSAQLSTVGIPVDNRRDMARELMAAALVAQLSQIEGVLQQIVLTGEKTTDKKSARDAVAARVPTSGEVQRALQNIHRDNGLVVTGRFDQPTSALLQQLGLVHTAPSTNPTKPTTAPTPAAAPTKAPTLPAAPQASPTTTAPTTTTATIEYQPIDPATRQQTRAASEARDLMAKAMRSAAPAAKGFAVPSSSSKPLDRALDPARLLASLVAGGLNAQQPPQALSSFQALVGLPSTGQLNTRTLQALVSTGVVSGEAAAAHTASQAPSTASNTAAPTKTSTTSSASASTARAVKETTSTTTGSGAATSAATTRASPVASPEAAREQARLESLLAQAAATERGVQTMTGTPDAVIGHGELAGSSTGISGSGGSHGGADSDGDDAAAIIDDRAAGDESSTGNHHGGDDDHDNTDRGDAVAAGKDDDIDADTDVVPDGHHKVPKLSVQVAAALVDIERLDDEVPVHYSWDVTLYRPGVYSDGQPAEAVWHLVVQRAHAFDPVWAQASMAIAMRLLAIEPEAEPPTLDELLGALRQARVR